MASRRKTVCVDLDGVLADYSAGWQGIEVIGEPIPGAVEFTRTLADFADVVIHTTRCCPAPFGEPSDDDGRDGERPEDLAARVRDWLDRHGFAYHSVHLGQGKPIAAAYVDDRAVACRPQDARSWATFEDATARVAALCDEKARRPLLPSEPAHTIRLVVEYAVPDGVGAHDAHQYLARVLRFIDEHPGRLVPVMSRIDVDATVGEQA